MIESQKQVAMFGRVDEWKKSGRTMHEFSSSIGLSRSCFEYWVRKKRASSESSPHFVELIPSARQLTGIEQPLTTNESTTQAQLVFTFPGGLCVKVYG
jgi:hypothetical protein